MKKIKRQLITVFLFILIEVGVLVFLSFMIDKKTKKLYESKHQVLALNKKEESILSLLKDYSKIKDQVPFINQALPDKKELVGFFSGLEVQAGTYGVDLKINFEKEAVVTTGEEKTVNLAFQMKGSFSQIVAFLKSLEKIPQILHLTDCSIKSPKGLEEEIFTKIAIKVYLDPDFN